ncbi:winged helix-turn-helix transcriptional regulator [Dyella sp. 2RAB6]|uniref:winged helix-turn-helix transcriptional regulator n=1 Tax=Dyella sp. 2RAB6 TaxID=3232992 RepID=UPI003F922526
MTLCLRGLERDGLVKRTVLASMPPHLEYELTAMSISLTRPVTELGMWAIEYVDDIDAARAAFDAQD